ncbi:MAG: SIMPL domain-containing protein [Hyphomicrobiales bacterium]
MPAAFAFHLSHLQLAARSHRMFRQVLAAGLMTFMIAAPAAMADETRPPRTISLTGHGEVKLAPDMALVAIGTVNQAATAAAALAANNASMAAVMAELKAAGIVEKDMQTSNFLVQPRYDYGNSTQPPRLVGYEVSNTLTVAVRNLDALGALLDRSVASGSNRIDGISFQFADPDAALDEARKRAAADAVRKARLYAAALSVNLGPILSVSESAGLPPPPLPMQMKTMGAEAMSAEVPIARGEQTVAVDVGIVWEIR